MGQVAQQLGGTLRPCAADVGPVLVPDHRGPAHRTGVGQMVGHGALRPLLLHHRDDLRDDLSRLLDDDGVPHPDVLLGDEVLVVEGGVGHRRPCKADRLYDRLGRKDAGASHLHHDVLHHALLLLGGILVGHRPAGEFRCAAQLLPVCKVIYLYDRSVDVKGVVLPVLPDVRDEGGGLLRRVCQPVVDDLEPVLPQPVQRGRIGVEPSAVPVLDVEDLDVQPPGGGHSRVQLPDGAGGGVAWVGHQRLSPELPLLVDGLEGSLRHEHLAPDDEGAGHPLQGQGDGADGAQILRHVLPDAPVPPGGAPDKGSVPVLQGDGKPVHLGLHQIGRLL